MAERHMQDRLKSFAFVQTLVQNLKTDKPCTIDNKTFFALSSEALSSACINVTQHNKRKITAMCSRRLNV